MSGTGAAPAFARLPDLASRALSGAVVAANDEFFAEKENLVLPEPPAAVADFGHKGKVYDGWETRRRRTPGHDWAIVRLGVARCRARRGGRHLVVHRQLPVVGVARGSSGRGTPLRG